MIKKNSQPKSLSGAGRLKSYSGASEKNSQPLSARKQLDFSQMGQFESPSGTLSGARKQQSSQMGRFEFPSGARMQISQPLSCARKHLESSQRGRIDFLSGANEKNSQSFSGASDKNSQSYKTKLSKKKNQPNLSSGAGQFESQSGMSKKNSQPKSLSGVGKTNSHNGANKKKNQKKYISKATLEHSQSRDRRNQKGSLKGTSPQGHLSQKTNKTQERNRNGILTPVCERFTHLLKGSGDVLLLGWNVQGKAKNDPEEIKHFFGRSYPA